MAENKKNNSKLTFEQALAQLEQIVEQIEQGHISLEESIDKYSRGVELIKQCRCILASAEQKIQQLIKAQDGRLEPGEELAPPQQEGAATGDPAE